MAMTPAVADMRITCFGGFRVESGGRDITPDLPGRQGRALLSYLVLCAPEPVSRDALLHALWPTAPPAAPEAALASVLAKVRRAVGPDVVTGRGAIALALPEGATVDAHEVSGAIDEAEAALAENAARAALDAAQRALTVLARPLLPSLRGDWVEAARTRFGDAELRALEIAARAGLALGDPQLAAAERAAAALVEREPFRERGYALLMEARARRGNTAEALRTFDQVRVLLREELGVSPSADLIALNERLLRGELPAAPAPAAPAAPEPARAHPAAPPAAPLALPLATRAAEGAFVARGPQLERLRAHWRETLAGGARIVVLAGEPGVGKTRLAARFADEVHREGGAVLYGRADAEALLPYQPFAEALRRLVAHGGADLPGLEHDLEELGRIVPGVAPAAAAQPEDVDHEALRFRVFEATVAVLTRTSERWPLLLVLDDLHWADKPTLLLLRHVVRHASAARLLMIGTFRHVDVDDDHPLKDLLADLRRERAHERLSLDGLDEAATRELVTNRLGVAVTPGFVRRLREQTAGNAFFIEETVRALGDPGGPVDEAALERLGVPEGVAEVIGRRIRGLSPLAGDVLTAASVVGRSFPLAIVEQLVDAGPDAVIDAVEESLAAGLVVEVPDRIDELAFSHALVREVLYAQLSGVRCVRLHHRVAQVLQRLAGGQPINPAELAHHFALARHVAGPEPARRYSLQAGRRDAELFAYEDAVAHFRRALELFGGEDDERERCEALLELAFAQLHAGDDAARRTFLQAADSADRRGDADQLARAALGLGERWFEITYFGARYRDLLEKALAALPAADHPQRALLLSRLAANLAFPDEDARAMDLATEAVAIARRLGNDRLLGAVLLARHVTLLDVRHLDERLAVAEELARSAGGADELAAELHHWRMYDLLEAGDLEAARAEQARLDELAAQLGQPLLRSLAAGARGLWAELAGDVDAAERCAEQSLHEARLANTQDALSSWASQVFALRRRQGRLAEIGELVERLARSGGHRLGWLAALGVLRLETGDPQAARAIYEEELRDGPAALPRGMFWLTRMSLLAELCARLGDAGRAEALYAELAPFAHRNVVVAYCSFWGPVERPLALLAEALGDGDRAARHADAARGRTLAMPAPLLTEELETWTAQARARDDEPAPAA